MSLLSDIEKAQKVQTEPVSEKPRRKKKSPVWSEVKTFTEEHTGLSVVVSERIRGRPGYSYHVAQKDTQGMNRFIQYPVYGLDKVPVQGEGSATAADVLRALVVAAEEWIQQQSPRQRKEKSKKNNDKKKPKGPKEQPRKGGLSSLAKADAEQKGFDYKTPAQRRQEKRQKAKSGG